MYFSIEGHGHINDLERSRKEGHFLLSQGQPDYEYVLTQQSLCKTYTLGLHSPPVFTSSGSSSATQLVSSYGHKVLIKTFQTDVLKKYNLEDENQQPFAKGQRHATYPLDDRSQGQVHHIRSNTKQNSPDMQYHRGWPDFSCLSLDKGLTSEILDIQKSDWVYSQYTLRDQVETQHHFPGPFRRRIHKLEATKGPIINCNEENARKPYPASPTSFIKTKVSMVLESD